MAALAKVEPVLAVVEDVNDLPRWMRRAEPIERDAALVALHRIAKTDSRAALVLAWLLVPGASLLAGRLHRLADVIDEVVAGQLWIQICEHDASDDTYVAKKILTRVEREAKAELEVGDLAERRDRTWASVVLVDRIGESHRAEELDEIEEPKEQLAALMRRALESGTLSDADRELLLDLAHAANAAGRRCGGEGRDRRRRPWRSWWARVTRWQPGRSDATQPTPSTGWSRSHVTEG